MSVRWLVRWQWVILPREDNWKASWLGAEQLVGRARLPCSLLCCEVPSLYLPLEALEWIIICDSVISREFSSGADLTALEIDTLT